MNSQVLQHLSVPETLGVVDIGNGVGFSDVPDPSVSPGGDPQVLLKTRDGTGGTGLILQVTSRSPGDEVRFQNLGPEVVISKVAVWIVSMFLKTSSVVLHERVS